MKRNLQVGLLVFLLFVPPAVYSAVRARRLTATCTGSTPCHACTNCRYCKHCAKEGGKCGVCKRRAAAGRQGSWEEAGQKLVKADRLHY
jgi:hypothetical protein